MLTSHCDLSIVHISLSTNMADSNRRQGRSHVGENQEFMLLSAVLSLAFSFG